MKTIVSGAEYWDFDKDPIFRGVFKQPFLREKDAEPDKTGKPRKAGDVIGFIFEDQNGDQHIISNSHQIDKALKTEGVGVGSLLQISFKGQGETKDGAKVNLFHVGELEEGDEGYFSTEKA